MLEPAKPLPAGKPVKCPECGNRFTAPEEEAPKAPLKKPKKAAADEPEAAERKPKKAADGKKAVAEEDGRAPAAEKKPAAKKSDDDEEGGVYGYVKEEEAEEEDKPDIEYAPDMSTKDLRGPAPSALVQPSNALIIVGLAGFFGWLALIVVHLIPDRVPHRPRRGRQDQAAQAGGRDRPRPGARGREFDRPRHPRHQCRRLRERRPCRRSRSPTPRPCRRTWRSS